MFLLDKFQERRHVRPAEMVDRFQTSEHAHFAQSLEVVLANVLENKKFEKITSGNNNDTSNTHQHGRSQVEFVEELSDKYVYF